MSLETESSDKPVGVLIVDDNPNLLMLTSAYLGGFEEYRATALNNPAEALALVKKYPDRFPFVITDFEMPGMNGIVLATRIREVNPETVIIVASGKPFEDIKKSDLDGVMDLYISKPSQMRDWQKILDEGQRLYIERLIRASAG